jgi:carbamoyl-phosphate synthase large subunit
MKSTGEVLGLSTTYSEAMYKAILAAEISNFPAQGSSILLTVRDSDKPDLVPLASPLVYSLGFELYGTGGTANYLNKQGIPAVSPEKLKKGTQCLDADQGAAKSVCWSTQKARAFNAERF